MSFHLRQILPPLVASTDDGPADVTAMPSRIFSAVVHLINEETQRTIGSQDFFMTDAESLASISNQVNNLKLRFAAVAGPAPQTPGTSGAGGLPTTSSVRHGTSTGSEEAPQADLLDVESEAEVLGYLGINFPIHDNTHLAEVSIMVKPHDRQRGIGTALLELTERLCREHGRRTITVWADHPVISEARADALGAALLHPATGVGALAPDESTSFATGRGFVLQQTERHSILDLSDVPDLAIVKEDAAGYAGADYRLHSWHGVTPPQWREPLARLCERMSTDVPSGELDFEEEKWSAERVHTTEVGALRAGLDILHVAAEHAPTGTLVAYTELHLPRVHPTVAYQEDTFVHGDHRGKRLGMLIKAAALEELRARYPRVERIHTWNASENRHMLAINEQLGYREMTVEAAWEKRLG